MTEPSAKERGQRCYSLFLKRIADVTQGDIAEQMGMSATRMSELKTKHVEDCIQLLAHLGLKVVPSEYVCMSKDAADFLKASHARVVQKAPTLLWGEGD